MISRRDFFRATAAASAASALRGQAPLLLSAAAQPKFVNPLPNPLAASFQFQPTTPGNYDIQIRQFVQSLGLVNPATGAPLNTTVWGYGTATQAATYPGRTIVARSNQPVTVRWSNQLPGSHLLPVDTSVHWANPAAGVPVVTHLHGGHTRADSDGHPDAWFTANAGETGRLYNPVYVYDNDQEGATLWYHDHALGITRLNVYAGLAGFYILRDDNEAALTAANQLPTGPYEIPLAIQDRMFTAAGQLHYPSAPPVPGAPTPSVQPEFFGNFMLVNGKTWPVLDVEPRQYRFRVLNGCDSRVLTLGLSNGQALFQIGTDNGFLNAPVRLSQVTLFPGERADIVVDFSDPKLRGRTIIVSNTAKTPFPKGTPVDPATTGQVMAFRVVLPLSSAPRTSLPANLRPLLGPLPAVSTAGLPVRRLLLFEGTDRFGRLQTMLGVVRPGSTPDGSLLWHEPATERPALNSTELWEVYNATADGHPIHLHLVSHRIVNRQKFSAQVVPKAMPEGSTGGTLRGIRLIDGTRPAGANEAGLKDTSQMFPGEVTRIVAKFDRPGEYVWHCHILSHEDHEMMRPLIVG